jgi:hypothetical protein
MAKQIYILYSIYL